MSHEFGNVSHMISMTCDTPVTRKTVVKPAFPNTVSSKGRSKAFDEYRFRTYHRCLNIRCLILIYFIQSLFWVAGRVFGLFVVCGIIGGLSADIPGLSEDPTGEKILGFIGRSFIWALTTFRDYPIGVAIYFLIVVLMRMMFVYPHAEKLKREIRDLQPKKKTRARKKHVKRTNARRRR